jgi:hypothetical protein
MRLGSSGRGEPAGTYLPEGDLGGIEVVESRVKSREAEDWCLKTEQSVDSRESSGVSAHVVREAHACVVSVSLPPTRRDDTVST